MTTINNNKLAKIFTVFSPLIGSPVYTQLARDGTYECLLMSDVSGAQRLIGRGQSSSLEDARAKAEEAALQFLTSKGYGCCKQLKDTSVLRRGLAIAQPSENVFVAKSGNYIGYGSTKEKAVRRCFFN